MSTAFPSRFVPEKRASRRRMWSIATTNSSKRVLRISASRSTSTVARQAKPTTNSPLNFFKKLYDEGKLTEETTTQLYDEEAKQFLADRYVTGECPHCHNEGAYGDQCEKCGRDLSPTELINPKSTISGSTPVLKGIVAKLLHEVDEIQTNYDMGFITDYERYKYVDDVWVQVYNELVDIVNGKLTVAEGSIVVTRPTDDGKNLEGKDIFGEDFKNQFSGFVFKAPAGKGTIKVDAETTGNMLLKMKIGSDDPKEIELNAKLKVTFPFNVSEPTSVYIYAGAVI